MTNEISGSLIKVMREFGVVGLVTYIGGLILLMGFFFEQNFQRQIILGIVGMLLLLMSIFIIYIRLSIQKEREKSLIKMSESTGNRLAEQLGKKLSEKSIEAIIQKIRQTQKDLMIAIMGDIYNKKIE